MPKQKEKRSIRCSVCTAETKLTIKLTKTIGLCEGCIEICNDILTEEGITYEDAPEPIFIGAIKRKPFATCAGCGKTDLEQARLIAFPEFQGGRRFVCNSCVGRLTKALQEALSGVFLKNK